MIGYTEVSDGSTGCLIVVNAVVTNYILVVVSPRYYKHWPAIGPDNYQSSSSEANYLCSSWGLVSSKFWLTMLWKEEGRKSMADWSTRRRDTHNMLLYSIKTYSYQRLWDKMPSVPYKKNRHYLELRVNQSGLLVVSKETRLLSGWPIRSQINRAEKQK